MRLIHTSDWHLGRTLHDHSRRGEHLAFLGWLLDQLEAERADALLIAGDLFETANPPAEAQADWYRFLAEARSRFPELSLVAIGGNHDSAARLDAPEPLLRGLSVNLVGGLRRGGGPLDLERLLVPLRDAEGEVAAWVCAVPFLRTAELPAVDLSEGDPLVEGVRRVYAEVLEAAKQRRGAGQALIAMGHLYMVGGEISELSERKILGGNQHALPVSLFPEEIAYAALGHLHLPQKVAGLERVRYCGSPLPLSMPEAAYPHQILVVDLEGERLAGVRAVPVPRSVELLRLPKEGPRPLEEVLSALRALPEADDHVPFEQRPYLEVRILLDTVVAGLRRKVEEALEGKSARLVTVSIQRTGDGKALGDGAASRSLRELAPEEVFRRRWARDHAGEVPDALLSCFHELLQSEAEGKEAA